MGWSQTKPLYILTRVLEAGVGSMELVRQDMPLHLVVAEAVHYMQGRIQEGVAGTQQWLAAVVQL